MAKTKATGAAAKATRAQAPKAKAKAPTAKAAKAKAAKGKKAKKGKTKIAGRNAAAAAKATAAAPAARSGPKKKPTPTRHHDPDADPFAVTADDIEALDKDQFRRFLRELMRNEIAVYGGSPSDLIDNPGDGTDDGQDLATVRSIARQGSHDDFVPQGETVWQSKAEKQSLSEAKLRKEIKKGRPTAVLKAGGSYRVLAQQPGNNENVTDTKLKDIAVALGYRADQVAFRAQAGLTERARHFPALARLPFFRKPLDKVLDYASWSKRWSVPVFDSAARASELASIVSFLSTATRPAHIRVIGPAGVGKTRLVLEALKRAGLASSTIYAENPASGQFGALFDWIESNRGRAVIVVDECSEQQAAGLRDRAVEQAIPVVLISIGRIEDDGLTSSPRDLRVPVPRMGKTDIVRILKTLVVLDDPTLAQIAHITGGFVKLAKVVADAIAANPALAPQPGVLISLDLIDEPLKKMSGFSDRALDWLSVVALFSEIRSDSSAPDSDLALIASFVGAQVSDTSGWIEAATTAEVLSDKGDHIFVTPSLLAVHLARRTIKKRRHDIKGWLAKLPQRLQEAFASQMAQLRFTEDGKRLAKELIGATGPFGNLLSVRQRWADNVLLALGSIAKDVALQQLRSALNEPSDAATYVAESDALSHLLFRLLWPADYFAAAFNLVLRGIDAVGEAASGRLQRLVIASLQVGLAITRLPFLPRLSVVRDEFSNGGHSTFVRRLLVRSIASGVGASGGEGYSDTDIEEDGREHWLPPSEQDAIDCAQRATSFVVDALADDEEAVQREAASCLVDHAAALIGHGAHVEVLAALPMALGIDRRVGKAREELERVLAFDDVASDVGVAVRDAIRALPQDLESRIRMLVEGWPLVEDRDEHGLEPRPEPTLVAQQIIDDGNRRGVIALLFEPWAENTYDLFSALARSGDGPAVWNEILDAARSVKKTWGPSVFLAVAHDTPVPALVSLPAQLLESDDSFDRVVGAEALTKSNASVEELHALTSAIGSGRIQPNALRYGIFARWAEHRDRDALADLIRAAASAEGDKSAAVALAHAAQQNLGLSDAEQVHLLATTMLDVQGHDAWKWEQLALRVARKMPHQLAHAIIERLRSWYGSQSRHGSERWAEAEVARVLEKCISQAPEVAAEALRLWEVMPYFVEHKLFSAVVNPLDVDSLVAWAEDEARQRALASIVRPANTPRVDELLVRLGATSRFAVALQRALVPRSWRGSLAAILEDRASSVRQWAIDPERSDVFRRWAAESADWLQRAADERRRSEDNDE